jgi:hypothetical protein
MRDSRHRAGGQLCENSGATGAATVAVDRCVFRYKLALCEATRARWW